MNKIAHIIIRFFAIIGILFLFCFLVSWIYHYTHQNNLKKISWLKNHIDIELTKRIGDQIYEIEKNDDISIFTQKYQSIIDDKIYEEVEKHSFTSRNPLLIHNPFGTNVSSLLLAFESDQNLSLEYTIETNNSASYTKRLPANEDHWYSIVGLVPEVENRVTIRYYNGEDLYDVMHFYVDMRNITSSGETKLEVIQGESQENLTDGLFSLLGHDKNFNSDIYLYDQDGVMRGEFPLLSYRTDRILFIDHWMVYSYDKDKFAFVNNLGKIEKFYTIEGYTMHHDFIYDDVNKKILILVNENGKDTIEDVVISLDIQNGEVQKVLDFNDYLKEMRESAIPPKDGNTYGGEELDWIHLNSLSLHGHDLFLSSRELSTIIKVSNIYTDPTVDYLISDPSMYQDFEYKNLLLNKKGDFVSQAGQHSITFEDIDYDNGRYYLIMYNNNYGAARTRPFFEFTNYPGVGTYKEGTNSKYYKYYIDENERTYELTESFDVPYSSVVSNMQDIENNHVISSGMDHSFGEYDRNGKLIREYQYEAKKYAYRAYKYDFKNFWFE